MDAQVSWLAVLLAAASSMIVGAIWYARPVFGTMWMELAGIDKRKKRGMAGPMVASVFTSFLTAYILAHIAYFSHQFLHHSFLRDAVMTALWLWLGLTAARFVTHDAFEGRPAALTMLTIAHELVTLVAMGVIIGLIHP